MRKKTFVVQAALLASLVSVFLLPTTGKAEVNVSISAPLPPLVISAPPVLVVIPGSYVYYPPDVQMDIFFRDYPLDKVCKGSILNKYDNTSLEIIESISCYGINWLIMIHAYIDESGTDNNSKIVSVACYAGTPDQWSAFINEWSPILENAGLPYFHAKDDVCDSLRPHLVRLIQKNELKGIVVTIDKSIYKNHTNPQSRTLIGNAYSACTFMCVQEICKWSKENNKEQIGFFIESGQANAQYVERVIRAFMDIPESDNLIASVSLVKKTFHPLATADFLSHICSVNDYEWQSKIDSIGNHTRADITKENLESASKEHKNLIIKQRNMRRAFLRQQKSK